MNQLSLLDQVVRLLEERSDHVWPLWLSTEKAALLLGTTPSTLNRAARNKDLPYQTRVGETILSASCVQDRQRRLWQVGYCLE